MQEDEGRFYPIAFGSKKLTSGEWKYSTTENLVLAYCVGSLKIPSVLNREAFRHADRPSISLISEGCHVLK